MSGCSPLCGFCGRCTEAWDRDDDERDDDADQAIEEQYPELVTVRGSEPAGEGERDEADADRQGDC